ncbi:GGDEF domain-containing protein [Metabacillus sp. KIGAM252]|uniref:GGDEF domain-containing protein n=1 Tax=Metabacillus flavus TaxID=2823519 RepID=A0ABS5LH30_9BACI|nr:sensor domain-containing diguanylate cyclase [Metabacillus flavus]MBS2969899.1 GGDEF domain-containing protein [Metabacillus flavus]
MDKRLLITLWLTWAIVSPIILYLTYQIWPPDLAGQSLQDLILFLVLMCAVALMPIVVNGTPVFFVEGVSLAVFLYFGLFAEMVMIQLAMIVLLLRVRIGWKDLYRYPVNFLMFMMISLVSGAVYEWMDGGHGSQELTLWFIASILVYVLVSLFVNYLILNNIIWRYIYKRKAPFFSRDFLWEAFAASIVSPFGFILYVLYGQLGILALFYVGLPIVVISIMLNHYYAAKHVNVYLQKASEVGYQLTERLKVEDVLDVFLEKITEMIQVDYAYIIDIVDQASLKVIRKMEDGKHKNSPDKVVSLNEGISGYVYARKKSFLFHKRTQWEHLSKYIPQAAQSMMAFPVFRHQQVVGVVILASNKRRKFENHQLMIVNLLIAHLAVAIENARYHEETVKQSVRCSLTGLYNYRFMEAELEMEFRRMKDGALSQLALILLDIDHFKRVNDTYGHQSGNEVLIQLANRLEKFIGSKGTAARYGGEEFVVLLPEIDRNAALALAEGLRKEIAGKPFLIEQDLEGQSKQQIFITASIGIAQAPLDADDALSLVRHADRAMYTGAKQAGRNKVAGYTK